MRSFISILALAGFVSFSNIRAESDAEKAISDAESKFYDAKSKIESDYRADLAKAIAKGDRIDVYLLDFEVEDTPSDFLFWDTRLEEDEFPITPYGGKSKILKRSELNEEQRKEFLPKLQAVIGFEGEDHGGAFCHFPIHGVRVFAGKQIIFQSSFCWKCSNFSISYPDAPAWVGIRGSELFDAFNGIHKIPQSEIDRLEAKLGIRKSEENK